MATPTVRAKFRCESKTESVPYGSDSTSQQFVFRAVMGKENEPWSKYTPAGSVDITITNPAAADAFKVGQKYFIDFVPVDEEQG